MRVCDKHKAKPAWVYGECVGCELDRLRESLRKIQTNAPTRWQAGYDAGVNSTNREWESAVAYGKEQEKLRFDENAAFTAEIMKLEAALESIRGS